MAPRKVDDEATTADATLPTGSSALPPLRRRHGLAVETGVPVDDHNDDDDDARKSRHTKRLKRRRKRRNEQALNDDNDDDVSFWKIFLQVGAVLGVFCFLMWETYRILWPAPRIVVRYDDDDASAAVQAAAALAAAADIPTTAPTPAPLPPLPDWSKWTDAASPLSSSRFDPYSLAATRYHQTAILPDASNSTDNNPLFWRVAAGLRQSFADLYGGQEAARALLELGLTNFFVAPNNTSSGDKDPSPPNDNNDLPLALRETACRLQAAKEAQRPFVAVFGGYSVTTGRGNYHNQAYPAVLEKLLHTAMQTAGIAFTVRNAALGGCPAFPYGWCGKNFFGVQPDVVSWDFSMNEAGGDPAGLEAYLRHMHQLSSSSSSSWEAAPKLIVKDTHLATARRDLLQAYHEAAGHYFQDAVILHADPAARPFLDRPEPHRPEGFQEWRKFGGPPGAPGQALHHPGVKEHAFYAWLLAMHFLSALQVMVGEGDNLQCPSASPSTTRRLLPPPLVPGLANATDPWRSILYGEEVVVSSALTDDNRTDAKAPSLWRMNPIHCRTTFEPIQTGDLVDLVVSGGQALQVDVMLPKSKMFYNKGWVLDLSADEKKAKHALESFQLGFVDSKKAFYGLVTSGPLTMVLPYEAGKQNVTPAVGDMAVDWFRSIVVCQVNEKQRTIRRDYCQLQDVSFAVGGVNATEYATVIDAPGTLYLGKQVCTHLAIPPDARLQQPSTLRQDRVKLPGDDQRENRVGLALQVLVQNPHILQREQACSVSHVIWEQQTR